MPQDKDVEATVRGLAEALETFARVADAFDYWEAEAMPDFTYPRDGVSLAMAQEDCPNAIGHLDYHDFQRAKIALAKFQACEGKRP